MANGRINGEATSTNAVRVGFNEDPYKNASAVPNVYNLTVANTHLVTEIKWRKYSNGDVTTTAIEDLPINNAAALTTLQSTFIGLIEDELADDSGITFSYAGGVLTATCTGKFEITEITTEAP